MNFAVLCPEITSAQMYCGAGSEPMLGAAASWAGLGDELGSAAECFGSVTAGLAGGPWQRPASIAMTAVATRYAGWLRRAASHAVTAATQAKTVAGIFEAAKAAVAHPMEVTANRMQFVSAVRSNLLGLNGPLIAAIEGAYDELWARNVTALVGYHGGASAAAAQMVPWQQALGNLAGLVRPLGNPAAATRDVIGVLGEIVTTDEAMVAAVWADNVSQLSSAAAVTQTALAAAAADVSAGKLVPAVGEVARAVDYDVRTAARLVAEDAALPAQLVSTDLRMLAGLPPEASALPTSLADPSSLEHYLAVKAARIAAVPGEILRADETLIHHVVDDNVAELGKAATVTGNELWAAQADLAAGDPMKAANHVAAAVSYDASTVARLAAEDAALPMSLAVAHLALIGAALGPGT
ncbi:PPE family protein [Mycobacterium ostraviense]